MNVTPFLLGLLVSTPAGEGGGTAEGIAFFEAKVRPLLVERCYECHSNEAEKVEGKLLLDSRAGWERGGETGPVIVRGKPSESLLVKAVSYAEDGPQMPPKGKLAQAEIDTLARWVSLGAPDPREEPPRAAKSGKPTGRAIDIEEGRKYWAFQPLSHPSPPRVRGVSWLETPPDAFVLSPLESKRLSPSERAHGRRQIRRAYLDVVGLPPTYEESRDFASDGRPDGYERVIDRLLASPRFGERWGRHWLDVARFAESYGFEHDYDRPYAYHYRDFVIRALNSDMPYDRFVRWQLAGDEFAPDSTEALAATGFLGAGVFPTQITANEVERTRYDALDDMLATTGSAMLGLSIGCARCHDHKFDPIPSRDYYRMLSTFTTTVRSEVDVDLDADKTRADWDRFERERQRLADELARFEREDLRARVRQRFDGEGGLGATVEGWTLPESIEAKSEGGATISAAGDGSLLVTGENPKHDVYHLIAKTSERGLLGLRIEAMADPSLAKGGPGRAANGNFGLTKLQVWAAPARNPSNVVEIELRNARATFEQKGLTAASVLRKEGGCWAVDPQFGRNQAIAVDLGTPIDFEGGTIVTVRLEFRCNDQHSMGRVRLSFSSSATPPGANAAIVSPILASATARIAEGASFDELNESQQRALVEWQRWHDVDWQAKHTALADHLAKAPRPALTKMMIASEGVTPLRKHTQGADFFPETYFLKRGDTNLKDGAATPGFLQVMMHAKKGETYWQESPPLGSRTSYRRKSLANWITDAEQGSGHLLARVQVNRIWQHYLGRGIVSTPNDFGVQGERPTHPELLDWLAGELIGGEWTVKRMHRMVLTSATYRQSSSYREEAAAVDPDDKLLWRFLPRRLDAEPIRDSLLYVSGLLDTSMFGPGTMDEGQRRGSIYFTVKRSRLTPMLQLFDAPDTLTSQGRRSQTTIAPQALVFLNDSRVRRWAESLGLELASPPPATASEAIVRVYRRVLGRDPTAGEVGSSEPFLAPAWHGMDRQARAASVADFAQVLFGLNEFLYVD